MRRLISLTAVLTGGEFQVAAAIDAASASSDTSLSEIVNGQCTEN